ncbi:MAG: CDK-activating kinase assembly factor MAT1-domain-containing protein [Piptocephalis tieghemiana]|nr:MAG: CDK-activating kinase assembly factor MAT1-domain-containing protein [Piptocephalis tieghemiana]
MPPRPKDPPVVPAAIPSITLSGSAAPSAPRDDRRDETCPICKSTRYTNPNLRIFISPWGGLICENCIERLHVTGPAKCATCNNKIARRQLYRIPTFSDLAVEREVWTRQRLAKIFNQREEDFSSLKEYNDHLELVEELTFNLVQGVDVEETEEKIAKFQMEHAQQITDNAKKEKAEKKMRTTALDAERDAKIKERNAILEAEAKEAREKKEEKEQLLRELAQSDRPAEIILAERAAQQEAKRLASGITDDASSGMVITRHTDRAMRDGTSVSTELEPPFDPNLQLYEYPTYQTPPGLYEPDEDWVAQWRADSTGKAAGWTLNLAHARGLDEAFLDLDLVPISYSAPKVEGQE